MPWLVDNVCVPAISNEILGPTLAAVGRADETRSCRAATVNQNNRSLVSRLCRQERFDVHCIGRGSSKEITFGELHFLRACGVRCNSRYHGEEKNNSISFHVGLSHLNFMKQSVTKTPHFTSPAWRIKKYRIISMLEGVMPRARGRI